MSLAISPALRDALERWLSHLAALSDASDHTIAAYRGDVVQFLDFLARHHGGAAGMAQLRAVDARDLRAWMAQARASGRGARSLARALSALKGFVRWLADRDTDFDATAILSARGEENPGLTYRVNQGGVYNVLEASREHRVSQVLFASTIAVFGPGLPDPVPDDVHLQPTTMYGVTKVGGELLGEYYNKRYGLDFRAVRFPGLISATLPGGGTSDYAPLMYVESMRTGAYEAFCRADTRIPMMYMPDGIRALIELSEAPRDRLQRTTYNIAAFSPTAEEIADSVARAVPGARITFKSDPTRQAILDSWPNALDDAHARVDWGWAPEFDLERMTEDLVPKLRALLRVNAS